MQIAVCVYRLYLIAVADPEACFRSLTRIECFSLIALLCLQRDPFDEVLRDHPVNKARMALDWEGMGSNALDPRTLQERRKAHKDEEVCAMCGKFCAVKMLRAKG